MPIGRRDGLRLPYETVPQPFDLLQSFSGRHPFDFSKCTHRKQDAAILQGRQRYDQTANRPKQNGRTLLSPRFSFTST